ncbi:reverse transcriptase domain-containing protein [Tanacetum coccineum]
MTLELANRSITYPIGIAEDVIVKVDKFIFLANFVIVDFEADPRVPIILGRPFLRTAKVLVDLYEEKLALRIENEELVFRAEKALRYPSKDHHSIHSIDIVDSSFDNDSIQDEPRSGSTTSHSNSLKGSSSPSLAPFETSDSLLEEFADELALINSFPPGNDDIDFDFEYDLRELEYLLNRDPSIDSTLKNNIEIIDFILEEFTDELSLVDSFPLGNDDDLFDFENDNEEWRNLLYQDPFDDTSSEKDKIKNSKIIFLLMNLNF